MRILERPLHCVYLFESITSLASESQYRHCPTILYIFEVHLLNMKNGLHMVMLLTTSEVLRV